MMGFRIIHRGDPMWIPFSEDRTVLWLLLFVGLGVSVIGVLAGEFGSPVGNALVVAGLIIAGASGIRLWWIK